MDDYQRGIWKVQMSCWVDAAVCASSMATAPPVDGNPIKVDAGGEGISMPATLSGIGRREPRSP